MFAYGEQIDDVEARQQFIHDMGRTVIEAYLRQDPSTSDDGFHTFLSSIANR